MLGEEPRLLAELDPKREHAVGMYPKDYEERLAKFPGFQRQLQDQYDRLSSTTQASGQERPRAGLWYCVNTNDFSTVSREKVGEEGNSCYQLPKSSNVDTGSTATHRIYSRLATTQ